MDNTRSVASQSAVVILCAGKGTRMGRSDMAKVCFEIDSVPAVNRTIQTFKRLRFSKFVIVVGSLAGQVMEIVAAEEPEALYVCQIPQLGTGDAAKKAAAALERIGHTGPVLVTLGDKFLDTEAIEALVEGFVRSSADLALATIPKTSVTEGSGGRVFLNSAGQALEIIEKPDIDRGFAIEEIKKFIARKETVDSKAVLDIAAKHFSSPKKMAVALSELIEVLSAKPSIKKTALSPLLNSDKYAFAIDGSTYTAAQIESRCKGVNPSLYLFTAKAFYQGVSMIDNNNAQKEYYLTDVVRHLNKIDARIRSVHLEEPDLIQGFNSPGELLLIQDYIRRKKDSKTAGVHHDKPQLGPRQFATVTQWLTKIDSSAPSLRKWLETIYGKHSHLHDEKLQMLKKALTCYSKNFGADQKVVIVRAPGRINLMGRHVDHRGGHNNFLAIDRETIAIAGLRDDDNVVAVNCDPAAFKRGQFSISELIGRFAFSDWINFVNSDWVRAMLFSSAGDWVNYIKAATLRLQHKYQDLKIRGMNIAVVGNVPMAAGLSSSSTIVVATLQAGIALNNLELTSRQFIDLCGEGEWFVGSRGGSCDHAAIYLGQRSKIAQVGYLPFRVERVIDAPADYQVVIANSHIKAPKSAAAKDMFNSRIAAYNLGLALLKQRSPEYASALEYVRDINPARLAAKTSDIYRLLMKVPEFMTRAEIAAALSSDNHKLMNDNFATHSEQPFYYIRGVLMFGAAECLRARMGMDLLAAGSVAEFGDLMKISHDGDRVARPGPDGYIPALPRYDDNYLGKLIADLQSEDPPRVRGAQLHMQGGTYACSTPEIDKMVDIACRVPGVAGAQIAGAGLGGCIMVLAKKDSVDPLKKALTAGYYKPAGLEPAIIASTTVEGAGLAEF